MGIYLGSTNVGGGGVQPTGSVTTTFTIGQDVMDEITSNQNMLIRGNIQVNTTNYKVGTKFYCNQGGESIRITYSNISGYISTIPIEPITINSTTYYGYKNPWGDGSWYIYISFANNQSGSTVQYIVSSVTIKLIIATSNSVETRTYTIPDYNEHISSGQSLCFSLPLQSGESLLFAEFTQTT